MNSGPMSYSVGGRQYVAVSAGTSLYSFALRQSESPQQRVSSAQAVREILAGGIFQGQLRLSF